MDDRLAELIQACADVREKDPARRPRLISLYVEPGVYAHLAVSVVVGAGDHQGVVDVATWGGNSQQQFQERLDGLLAATLLEVRRRAPEEEESGNG